MVHWEDGEQDSFNFLCNNVTTVASYKVNAIVGNCVSLYLAWNTLNFTLLQCELKIESVSDIYV